MADGSYVIHSGAKVDACCVMTNIRLIARLDIKGPNLIKGIQLEGLRVVRPANARPKILRAGR